MSTAAPGTMFRLILIFLTLSAINSVFTAPAKVGVCSKPMDIAFLVDISGSIGRQNIELSKALMEKTVDYFGMSDQGNHYAITTFSTNSTIKVKFNTFTGIQVRSANLKRKIRQIQIDWWGYSFIDKALLEANTRLFTAGAGMRQNALKVAFVFTDGIQTRDKGFFLDLNVAGDGLRKKGVQLLSVGVSNDMDVLDLMSIATRRIFFYAGRRLSRYPSWLNTIASVLCSNPTTAPTSSPK